MECQYGCGRRSHKFLDACKPCYSLVHGKGTANKILQLIKKKQCSESESIFKIERFLLERNLDYLKNRLRHILEEMCVENCWRYSRKFLRQMKRFPQDLLSPLNRFFQDNPHDDEEFLVKLDHELSFYNARRYGRSSSEEEIDEAPCDGNREENVASCSGQPEEKKRKHSSNGVFPSEEITNDENEECEPPKKRQAKVEKTSVSKKRLHSSFNLEDEEKELETPSKRRAGETNELIVDDSSMINIEDSLQCSDHDDLQHESVQPLKQKRFRRKKRSELELLKVGLPPYFQTKIVLSPISHDSILLATPPTVSPVRQLSGTVQCGNRGRPKKQPCEKLRDKLGRFVRDESKARQPPCPKVRRRRTELELLKAGLPLFFQS